MFAMITHLNSQRLKSPNFKPFSATYPSYFEVKGAQNFCPERENAGSGVAVRHSEAGFH